MMKKILLCAIFSAFLFGCTDNGWLLRSNGKDYVSNDKNGVYKIGEPYQINNIWYRPEENYKYREVGIASWYGPDFHRGITANGETYNMYELSAAHKTLPLPSIVKVTNLDNGKSVVVRVNDRGPFVNNRIIDLSKAAAEQLDMIETGTAKVRVEILADESKDLKDAILSNGGKLVDGAPFTASDEPPAFSDPIVLSPNNVEIEEEPVKPVVEERSDSVKTIYTPKKEYPTSVNGGSYYVQAGAFSNRDNALAVQRKLSSFGRVSIQEVKKAKGTIYRVRSGGFATGEEAADLIEQIEQSGYTDLRLIQER